MRRIPGDYKAEAAAVHPDLCRQLQAGIAGGMLDAAELMSGYCALLYERYGTYEEVARRTNLDRRTVKAYISRRQVGSESQLTT